MKNIKSSQKVHKVHKAKKWSGFRLCRLSTLRTDFGFTLVETLVAIAIIMIAVVGPLTVAEKGLSAAIYARDQLMASYLAQDGVEFIRNIVDTNQSNIQAGAVGYSDGGDQWITVGPVSDGGKDLLTSCVQSNPCMIDTSISGGNITNCGGSSSSCLHLILGSTGYIQTGTGSNSPFTRYFYVQPFTASNTTGAPNGGSNNAANVVVVVTWQTNVSGGGGVTLEDTLFDSSL